MRHVTLFRDGVPASRLQLTAGPWTTVLDALVARFPAVDRATWCDRFARGRVCDARGVALARDAPFRVGIVVHYWREVAGETRLAARHAIVHADERLVVADKPAGLAVVPTGRFAADTLLARLVRELGNEHLVPLHRIDRDTGGLVLFSAHPGSRAIYHALFRARAVEKRYEALAPPLPSLSFPHVRRSRLARGEPFFRMVEVDGEPNSETRIDVVERGDAAWRYALWPVTGRKHQLRVHLAALGAPIAHDPLYPRLRERDAAPLALLAQALAFDDPIDGGRRRFVSGFGLARP
jgi:tRNA pseudouridine32 synthase / 23S rRNA pseudouridine746 synthase